MIKKASKSDMLWGYIAQSLNLGAGLLLLPPILYYFTPEDVGLWFVFITLASLAQLLELGFQPTLARNATYVYSGVKNLTKTGVPNDTNIKSEVNDVLLNHLIEAGRKIYSRVAVRACIALILGGSFYISTLKGNETRITINLIAWILFASGSIITFYFGYYNGLLLGRGEIGAASKVTAITRGTLIILGSISTVSGLGLIGLGASSLVSSIAGRYAAKLYFAKSKITNSSNQIKINSELVASIIETMQHNAHKLGAVQLGAFFTIKGNILVATSFLGLAEAASYSITINILTVLIGVSIVAFQLQMPHVTSLQINNNKNKNKIKAIFGESILISWMIFTTGAFFIILYGNNIINIIGSKTNILPIEMLTTLSVIFLLELNHSIAATFLTSKNNIPFLIPSLISGAFVLIISTLFSRNYGLWAPILAQGIVQLSYNNWKWPKEAAKTLEAKYIDIVISGGAEIKSRIIHFK